MTRDFTVATFVVHQASVLLLFHRTLKQWLPPGGHIEPNELPDEAALREVREETGVEVALVGERALDVGGPRQLVRPMGVQLESISPGHEHIDLVYFARPVGSTRISPGEGEAPTVGWYDEQALAELPLSQEIRAWVDKALRELASVD